MTFSSNTSVTANKKYVQEFYIQLEDPETGKWRKLPRRKFTGLKECVDTLSWELHHDQYPGSYEIGQGIAVRVKINYRLYTLSTNIAFDTFLQREK